MRADSACTEPSAAAGCARCAREGGPDGTALLLDVEKHLYSLTLPPPPKGAGNHTSGLGSSQTTLPGRVEPGSFIFSFLAAVKLTPEGYELVRDKLAAAVALLVAGAERVATAGWARAPSRTADVNVRAARRARDGTGETAHRRPEGQDPPTQRTPCAVRRP